MAQAYFSLVTTNGKIKLADSAAGGDPVVITHFAIGDGNGAETNPTAASTALVREVWRTPVESVVTDPDNPSAVLVTAIIPTGAGGWWMREFGIFDQAGTMIAVAKPVSQYKPTAQEGQLEDIRYEFQIIIGETANVQLIVDPSVLMASRQWVESRKIPMGQLMRLPWIPVISVTLSSAPGNPAVGDTYLIPSNATGIWATSVGKIAEWDGTAWSYLTPPGGHGISLPDGRIFERIGGAYVEKIAVDVQSGKWNYAIAGGTANAITANLTPALLAYTDGLQFRLRAAATTTSTTPTIALNGLAPKTVVNPDGSALTPGAIVAGAIQTYGYDAALDKVVLVTPANTGVKQGSGWIRHSDGTYEAWGQAVFSGTTTQVDVTLPVTFPTVIDSVLVADTGDGVFPGAGWPQSTSVIRCYVQRYIINNSNGAVQAKNTTIVLWYRCWGK